MKRGAAELGVTKKPIKPKKIKKEESTTHISDLPPELIEWIFSSLNTKELFKLREVSKEWGKISQSDFIWSKRRQADFPPTISEKMIEQGTESQIYLLHLDEYLESLKKSKLEISRSLLLDCLNGNIDRINQLDPEHPQKKKAYIVALANGHFEVIDQLEVSEIGHALRLAIRNGALDVVKSILGRCSEDDCFNGLDIACGIGNLELVQYILKNKDWTIDIYETDIYTLIQSAVKHGHLEVVKYLYGAGDVEFSVSDKLLDLKDASAYKQSHIVRYFLEEEGLITPTILGKFILEDIQEQRQYEFDSSLNRDYHLLDVCHQVPSDMKNQILSELTRLGFVLWVKHFIQIEKDISLETKGLVLCCALRENHIEIAKFFIHVFQDIPLQDIQAARNIASELNMAEMVCLLDEYQHKALIRAASKGDSEAIEACDGQSKGKALVMAAAKGRIDAVKQLHEKCDDFYKNEALMKAVTKNHLAIVEILQDQCHEQYKVGALITAMMKRYPEMEKAFSSYKGKALEAAASRGMLDIVKTLLKTANDAEKIAALMRACANGQLEVVKRILRVLIEIENKDINEAVYVAYIRGHQEVVKYFYKVQNISNIELLCLAVQKGSLQTVQSFSQVVSDRRGFERAQAIALKENHSDIAKFLSDKIAEMKAMDSDCACTISMTRS